MKNGWNSEPYTKEQRAYEKHNNTYYDILHKIGGTYEEELTLIENKTSLLSHRERGFVKQVCWDYYESQKV